MEEKWATLQSALPSSQPGVDEELERRRETFLPKVGTSLIYFSLGFMAYVQVDLMQRLIGFMAALPYQFLVVAELKMFDFVVLLISRVFCN